MSGCAGYYLKNLVTFLLNKNRYKVQIFKDKITYQKNRETISQEAMCERDFVQNWLGFLHSTQEYLTRWPKGKLEFSDRKLAFFEKGYLRGKSWALGGLLTWDSNKVDEKNVFLDWRYRGNRNWNKQNNKKERKEKKFFIYFYSLLSNICPPAP